jgi:hypothetical protein
MKKLALGALGALALVVVACTAGSGPLPSGEFLLYEPPKGGGERGPTSGDTPGGPGGARALVCAGYMSCEGSFGGQAFRKTIALKLKDGECEGDGRYYGDAGRIVDKEGQVVGSYVLLPNGGFTATLLVPPGTLTCNPTDVAPPDDPAPTIDASVPRQDAG